MKSIHSCFTARCRAVCYTFYLICLWIGAIAQSNIQQSVSINASGAAAHGSAMLDVNATDKGILVPRMTSAQRTAIVSPATGLLVFDTTTGTFWFYNGTDWIRISPQSMLADADGDTRVQVEKFPDEDIIRFDLGGTENMVLRKNASGHARLELSSGNSNSFFGTDAGAANTTGYDNTAVGSQALSANSTGYRNTATGRQSLSANTTGYNNTANGFQSLFVNTSGYTNTATGRRALYSNIDGYGNTATGRNALFSNTAGDKNTATGQGALLNNTSGFENCAFGVDALMGNTEGHYHIAIGKSAMASLSAYHLRELAIGDSALFSYTSGYNHTAVGSKAAFNLASTLDVTAVGYQAMFNSTSGNSALGHKAMLNTTTGNFNTAVGRNSLPGNTTGRYNTGVGTNSLVTNATGQYNTALGNSAYFTANNLSYTTCIGSGSGGVVNASFRIEIGNTSVSWIGGQVGWSTFSDARIKTQVKENVPGLAFITQLRPVTYHLDIQTQNDLCFRGKKETGEWDSKYDIEQKQMTGFIAQEVEAAAKAAGYDFSGVEQGADEVGIYSVRYAEFVVPLVKAVQEQQALLENGNARLEKLNNLRRLKAENADLQSQLEKITAALAEAGIFVEK